MPHARPHEPTIDRPVGYEHELVRGRLRAKLVPLTADDGHRRAPRDSFPADQDALALPEECASRAPVGRGVRGSRASSKPTTRGGSPATTALPARLLAGGMAPSKRHACRIGTAWQAARRSRFRSRGQAAVSGADSRRVSHLVRYRSHLDPGAHFCSDQIVSSVLANTGDVRRRAIGEKEDSRRSR